MTELEEKEPLAIGASVLSGGGEGRGRGKEGPTQRGGSQDEAGKQGLAWEAGSMGGPRGDRG